MNAILLLYFIILLIFRSIKNYPDWVIYKY